MPGGNPVGHPAKMEHFRLGCIPTKRKVLNWDKRINKSQWPKPLVSFGIRPNWMPGGNPVRHAAKMEDIWLSNLSNMVLVSFGKVNNAILMFFKYIFGAKIAKI
jgi:hypothetical protein